MKTILCLAAVALVSSQALAQTPDSGPTAPARPQSVAASGTRQASKPATSLATPTGQELDASLASYTYTEPDGQSISIHGPKVGGEYTGTTAVGRQRQWFIQANVRGIFGNTSYDGWCYPFVITPDKTSPNGYALGVGSTSACSEQGDKDWYVEGRGLVGKDMIGERWGVSPYSGLGFRHLSNGVTGVAGYRTDNYLYVPAGLTARSEVGSSHLLSLNVEYDLLIHGWQTTRDSLLGGGDAPATSTAPAFTINSFSDISFSQHRGWALRASAKYALSQHWSVEPYYLYWNVSASPVSEERVSFAVNGVTAVESMGAYEPNNTTREAGVKLGFHF